MDKKRETYYTVKDICEILEQDYEIIGLTDRIITHPAPIDSADKMAISFCVPGKEEAFSINSTLDFSDEEIAAFLNRIKRSAASIVVCSKGIVYPNYLYSNKTLILTENPRLAFMNIVEKLFATKYLPGIHETAVISKTAEIDETCYIGPFTYVDDNCKIGEDTVLHGNIYIYPNTIIGSNVIIHAGTIIGGDGFGFWRTSSGHLMKFPHVGGVVIGDFVEIGSNVSIDRGTLGNTIIGEGTKIDNFVHVAHNVRIGKHCAVIAHSMLGGSVIIGNSSWIAPSVAIRDRLTIGNQSVIGMASVVIKDVPDGATIMGFPAKPIDEYKKLLSILKQMVKKRNKM